MNLTKDQTIALRELANLPEWRAYSEAARQHLEDMVAEYLSAELSDEDAFRWRVEMKAIKKYQAYMNDVVRQASDIVNQLVAQERFRDLEGGFDAGIEH